MGPEGNILLNSPFSSFQQSLTHSAMWIYKEAKYTYCKPASTQRTDDINFLANLQSRINCPLLQIYFLNTNTNTNTNTNKLSVVCVYLKLRDLKTHLLHSPNRHPLNTSEIVCFDK